MAYDLVIKNGTVIDGSGLARYHADIGVKDGIITTIGKIASPAKEVIDADGQIVSPGFVDGHTHMDAQVFWDPLGTNACYHGVTSVVMGNCGFTLAPCREKEADLVFRNLERAEDISRDALLAGIKWRWETFPEFLDVVDTLPKGINYSTYIGHSALRTYVMGERAFTDTATDDDLKTMVNRVQEAVRAGAMGFSTSRSVNHQTADDRPVASRLASWDELAAIVRGMGQINSGILEVASANTTGAEALDYYSRLGALSAETGRPITFGMFSTRKAPNAWRPTLDLIDKLNLGGARMFAQVQSRPINAMMSFETHMPFDKREVWKEFRKQPLAAQLAGLRNPETRRRLLEIAKKPHEGPETVGAEMRPPDWDWIFVMDKFQGPHKSLAQAGRERGVHPAEAMIDIAMEHDLKFFFNQPLSNENEGELLEMMQHPRTVVTFSDTGAHVSQIDNALHTWLLGYWVRERKAFTLEQAVRCVTYETATQWGFHDRGLLREGMAADIVVFDADRIAPLMPVVATDLPAGAKRLSQKAVGISATIVNGSILLKDNKHTGALPGRLLRKRVPN